MPKISKNSLDMTYKISVQDAGARRRGTPLAIVLNHSITGFWSRLRLR
ncbi:hypothetical protein HN588_13070 [Candidatus Bathyarchaeota archaeon]|nr:hypothetical protein [Candidatus Bathyarchaeota archaeon]